MASSASDCRRDIIHRWSLLVRLVRLQSRYPLDRAYPFWAPHWFRSPIHLPPIPQLPCGCLSHVVSGTSLFLYIHVKKKKKAKAYALLHSAASAIAANTLLRSLAGAVFPLFAQYMFASLKVNYAGTLLGCVALVLVPIPVAFWKYGHKLRARSKFAPTPKPQVQVDGEV